MAPMPRRHDWTARPVANSFSTNALYKSTFEFMQRLST